MDESARIAGIGVALPSARLPQLLLMTTGLGPHAGAFLCVPPMMLRIRGGERSLPRSGNDLSMQSRRPKSHAVHDGDTTGRWPQPPSLVQRPHSRRGLVSLRGPDAAASLSCAQSGAREAAAQLGWIVSQDAIGETRFGQGPRVAPFHIEA